MPRFAPALLLVFFFAAGEVWATDSKEEAKSRFSTGLSHYNLNEFAQALQEFKEAYRLYPDPVFLYNAGQCERQLNHYEEAIAFYRSFLRNQPKAPNRNEVKRKIEELENALKNKASAPPEPAGMDEPAPAATTLPRTVAPPTSASPTPLPVVEKPIEPTAQPSQPMPEATAAMPAPQEAKPSPLPLATSPAPALPFPATRMDLSTTAPIPVASPAVYRRWWFWTATGVVLAGATTALVLSLSGDPAGPPASALGGKKVF